MNGRIAALFMTVFAGCAPPHATGELGAVQYAYCDPEWFGADGLCSGSIPLAVGARALLFVYDSDGRAISSVVSGDPSVLDAAPSGISNDIYVVTAYREGSAAVSVLATDGSTTDRFTMSTRDIMEIRLDASESVPLPLRVPPRSLGIGLGCHASDGRRLVGLGALDMLFEGVDGHRRTLADQLERAFERTYPTTFTEYAAVRGPVEGGTGRFVATAPSGVSIEVPLQIERAHVEQIELRVVETSEDQGRVAATIEVEADREACCEWSVIPAGGPITVRRAECDYMLVDSSQFGVPTTARVQCTVLDRTESIAITVGVDS